MNARAYVAAALAALLAGCASLPSLEGRSESSALRDTGGTRLGMAVAPRLAESPPGKSGIHPLPVATDAFAARALLTAAAERSIDVQYYIWHADQTGLMLFEALWKAAQRGVRVRLLLDDQNTAGLDETLAALGTLPNFEIRLYNPMAQRHARFANYFGDFERLNRRMHNKSFTVDNQATIVGGRNIGNEYFGAGVEVPFKDLDVLAIGPVVAEVSAQFDLYWASASAYPAARIVGVAPAQGAARLEERFAAARADPQSARYVAALRDTPLVKDLLAGRLALEWAQAQVVRDDPAKTLDPGMRKEGLALAEMLELVGTPRISFDLISPYFIPGEKGTESLARLARSGTRVRVLTNSLAGSEAAVVHSGYAKRRCELARAGVKLYELKPSADDVGAGRKHDSAAGSSSARLHAKTFAVDGRHAFVGSFNFDMRSALLNTELGVIVASPMLAARLAALFDDFVPANAYEVRARTDGACVEWVERTAAGEVVHADEPESGWLKRAWLGVLMALPLDWML